MESSHEAIQGQKGDGSRARNTRHCGLVVQQLVIPPLLRTRDPDAVLSSLGDKTLEPSPRYHDSCLNLERASQHGAATNPTKLTWGAKKGDGSRARHTRHCGLRVQQLVIPPLSRARDVRCSVRPALRVSLKSRNQDTRAFDQVPWLNSQLGVGKPA
ncbi:hypothetical protein PIB30_010535 [Stylosanthes scabra]|uniref:Uncharacterized protein n=1 Tax=Stylosanthes scabra TaxID=79078 RepID=A0ABU6R614_9FABA|nr:hypothetical protein [Stylosanthes scabra]